MSQSEPSPPNIRGGGAEGGWWKGPRTGRQSGGASGSQITIKALAFSRKQSAAGKNRRPVLAGEADPRKALTQGLSTHVGETWNKQ